MAADRTKREYFKKGMNSFQTLIQGDPFESVTFAAARVQSV